jgi:hypothetical protein
VERRFAYQVSRHPYGGHYISKLGLDQTPVKDLAQALTINDSPLGTGQPYANFTAQTAFKFWGKVYDLKVVPLEQPEH